MIVLVGGGSRSGKSAEALRLLNDAGPRRAFIATAQALDDEMRDRIGRHSQGRGPDIATFEEPLELAARIRALERDVDAVVVDCLTLWLSNLMLSDHPNIGEAARILLDTAAASHLRVILVTNEVGCGIVPDTPLGRRFRDEAGRLNQLAAAQAAEVYWMIFGIRLKLR